MTAHPQRDFALEIVSQLRAAGYEALWAGGCVRDQLLGREPKDYDVATNARPEEIQKLFGPRRTLALGAAFGVIGVLSKTSKPVEVATFRSDGAYLDGRHPSSVVFTTAEHDAQRRDFTINGMFFDPLANRVIDYVGGQADLLAGVVRAIGDPLARFTEDKLRLLRAVRFATTFDFQIEPGTLAAIQTMAEEINVVSAERIGAEFARILQSNQRGRGLELLYDSGLLRVLLPALAVEAAGNTAAWTQTLQICARLESENASAGLAALFVYAPHAEQVATTGRRFRFSNKETELAAWLVKQLPAVAAAAELPWPQIQRILTHEGVRELMALARAAWGTSHKGVQQCQTYLEWPSTKFNPAPLLTGDDLVAHGFRPGPHFAHLLTAIRDAQLEGHIDNKTAALELAAQLLAELQSE